MSGFEITSMFMLVRSTLLLLTLFVAAYTQTDTRVARPATGSPLTLTLARPFTDIAFEISTPTQSVLQLQPIPLIVRQKNDTDQAVLGYRAVDLNSIPAQLYIRRAGSAEISEMGQFSQLTGCGVQHNTEVAPHSVLEAREWLVLGLDQHFPEPGNYEMKLVVRSDDRSHSVESNTVEIEVRAPTGSNRDAYNFVRNSGYPESLFTGDDFPRLRPILETILIRYPNSPYAKCATFALGQKHFILRQYPQALGHLIRLEYDNNFILAEKVRRYLAEIRAFQASTSQ